MTIDFSKLRNVGIMSVRYLTDEWETPFGLVMPPEQAFNPTKSGIVFFCWHGAERHPGGAAANQTRFFQALHEQLKLGGGKGFDAVYVFGDNPYSNPYQSIDIADGIKRVDKNIPVYTSILDVPGDLFIRAQKRGSIDKILGGYTNGYAPAFMRALKLPQRNLSAAQDREATRQLYALEEEYRKKYPGLFDGAHINPEKLAQSVPERPAAQRPGDPGVKPPR